MSSYQLPHTLGCLVCGRENRHGLRLDLHVEPESGLVWTDFTPLAEHIGFEGIVHGGVLATVLDEVMVWAATWAGRRFCVCAEMTVRFLQSAAVGQPIRIEASVVSKRRVIQAEGKIINRSGVQLAAASGKYMQLPESRHRTFVATMVDSPQTEQAMNILRRSS